MSDLSVGIPFTFEALTLVCPDKSEEYMNFLIDNVNSDLDVKAGMIKGGQEFLDWMKTNGEKPPTGLSRYLLNG